MATETEIPAGKPVDNPSLVQQLLSEARSGSYEGSTVRITAYREDGTEYQVVGRVRVIDLSHEKIHVQEAQAIEGVAFKDIRSYKWLGV